MRRLTPLGKEISKKIGRAIKDYNLIAEGDKILVGVSGGKDSLTLLAMLAERKRWAPVDFELLPVHIKTDFSCSSCMHPAALEEFFKERGFERYLFEKVSVLNDKGTTTCFWCSWQRRKVFFELARKHNFNKIAFGHHKDDIVETTLLNMFFQGEFATMNPNQEFFGGEITLIRPLCYVDESMIIDYAKECNFTSQLCQCPIGKKSNRKRIKKFIADIEREVPNSHVKTNILRSMQRVRAEYCDVKVQK